jgi:hypothetical protein
MRPVGDLFNLLPIDLKTGVPPSAVSPTIFQVKVKRQIIPACTPGIQLIKLTTR